MALTLYAVPDCSALLGPSQAETTYDLVPSSTSDYPSSGYPINAGQVSLGQLYGASVIASNAAAALYDPKFVIPNADLGSTAQPATQILMEITVADVQSAVGTDLTACKWRVVFRGY